MSQPNDRSTTELSELVRTVHTAAEAMRLWKEHEQGSSRSYRPDGLERPGELQGATTSRQAWLYVREVTFYRRAYPSLWWEWVRGRDLATFDAREYLALQARDLVRDPDVARRKLGWLLPHRDGKRLWTAAEVRDLFWWKLERRLKEAPLKIVPRTGMDSAADVAQRVEDRAREKWGNPPASLRDWLV